ncbi:MAG: hypothetical protein ACOVOF_04835 [Chryseotalea sp.]|jgi:hypothetical protein|nr:hypothetical protein [Cytophagales bacterium]
MKTLKTYQLIGAKSIFTVSLIIMALTILSVYFWGLGQHNTFYENSMLSTTILSVVFFLFISISLYKGVKVKDDLGNIVGKFKPIDTSDLSTTLASSEPVDLGEGIGGAILSIILWIVMALVFSVAIWIFSNVVVIIVLTFVAMLYWVFFRALRLIFKNSNKSKGDFIESIKIGFGYTILYNFWIYGIFILTLFFKK